MISILTSYSGGPRFEYWAGVSHPDRVDSGLLQYFQSSAGVTP